MVSAIAGQRRALALEAADQFRGEMLRVGRRAAVAAGEDLAVGRAGIRPSARARARSAPRAASRRRCFSLRAVGEMRRDLALPAMRCRLRGILFLAILLDVHLELDAPRRIRDARARRLTRARSGVPRSMPQASAAFCAPRHVAELAAAPLDAHRVRVVRIVRLAHQSERVAAAAAARPRPPRHSGSRRAANSAPATARSGRAPAAPAGSSSSSAKQRTHCGSTDAAGFERIQQQHVEAAIGVRPPHEVKARGGDQAGRLAAVTLSAAPPKRSSRR